MVIDDDLVIRGDCLLGSRVQTTDRRPDGRANRNKIDWKWIQMRGFCSRRNAAADPDHYLLFAASSLTKEVSAAANDKEMVQRVTQLSRIVTRLQFESTEYHNTKEGLQ